MPPTPWIRRSYAFFPQLSDADDNDYLECMQPELPNVEIETTVPATPALVNALINVPDFRHGVFSELGATTASMLKQVCNLQMTKMEMEKYFNPVKDLVHMNRIISTLEDLGYAPYLVGLDTFSLITRITDPIGFWETGKPKRMLTFWLVINTNDVRTLHGQRLLYKSLLRLASNATIWSDICYDTMEMTFDVEYPFRLNVYMPVEANDSDRIYKKLGISESNPIPVCEAWTKFKNEPDEVVNWNFLTMDGDGMPSTGIIDLMSDPFIAKRLVATVDRDAIPLLQQMFRIVKTGNSDDIWGACFNVIKFEIGKTNGAVFSMDMQPLEPS